MRQYHEFYGSRKNQIHANVLQIHFFICGTDEWLKQYLNKKVLKQKSTETKKRHKCPFCLYGSNRLNTVFDRVGVLHVEGFKNNVPYLLKIL